MRASQFFISTLKEAPADAEVISHKLMVRAGMIRRLGSGIYAYMPMGLRVIYKVENIILEEMNRSGAVELLCLSSSLPNFGRKPADGRNTALNCCG